MSSEWVNIRYINISHLLSFVGLELLHQESVSSFLSLLTSYSILLQPLAYLLNVLAIGLQYHLSSTSRNLTALTVAAMEKISSERLTTSGLKMFKSHWSHCAKYTTLCPLHEYNTDFENVYFSLTLKMKQNQGQLVSSCLFQTGLFQSGPSAWTKWTEIAIIPERQRNNVTPLFSI